MPRTQPDLETLRRDEWGTINKRHRGRLRVALAYPNTYHVAMSCLGFQTVYRLFNEFEDVVCERVFLPPEDLSGPSAADAGLKTFESGADVRSFDLLAFSTTFEQDYVYVLKMLQRAGIPTRPADRHPDHPLMLVGGVAMSVNPEPLAPFADLMAVGDGEVTIGPLIAALSEEQSKMAILDRLVGSPGFYHPHLYQVKEQDGRVLSFEPAAGAPASIRPAKAEAGGAYPHRHSSVITPHTEFGKTLLVELSNGCRWGCRFCWIGYNQLPPRNAPHLEILELARQHQEVTRDVGLVAASVCDYPELYPLLDSLREGGFRTTLAALRIDAVDDRFADAMAATGQKTPTMAPEAGSDRLRKAINKNFTSQDIIDSADRLFARGFRNLKLYFIVGIPTETQQDVEAIVSLVDGVRERMLAHGRPRGNLGSLSVRVSCFVPKPNIPLQWLPMEQPAALEEKVGFLRKSFSRMPNVRFNVYSPKQTLRQAVLSMGGRELAPVLEAAASLGSFARAFKQTGMDPVGGVYRERARDELFPWDILNNGMSRDYLWKELQRLQAARVTAPCPEVEGCHRCAVC